MTRVKICGLSEPATLDVTVAAGADYVGFVFYDRSPRNVSIDQARGLGERVPRRVGRVGVFVAPDDELVEQAVALAGLDAVQVHGISDPARLAALADRARRPLWYAVAVATRADIDAAVASPPQVDCLLFDAKAPIGSDLPGGNGVRFDWRLLAGCSLSRKWGLAGGLDPHSVADAVHATGAPLVDVSSGVEDAPGVKSADKIRAFIRAVRDL